MRIQLTPFDSLMALVGLGFLAIAAFLVVRGLSDNNWASAVLAPISFLLFYSVYLKAYIRARRTKPNNLKSKK
jgi:hypothetical protein